MDKILQIIRNKRNFNPEIWINDKIEKFNNYCKENNISSCVVSVSGGIDSAVTYKLCQLASQIDNSPILS